MRAKLINEGIGDLLKPKTDAEIDNDLKKLSGDELYDLFRETGDAKFLEKAAKKGITDIYAEDLAELLNEYPSMTDEFFPIVVKKFPLKLEKNKKGGYSLLITWWDELYEWFEENDEIDLESIEKILAGDAFDLFEYDEEVDLTELHIRENKLYDGIKNQIQNDYLSELNNFKTLDEMFKYIGEHEDEYYELAEALKIAVGEAKAVADESQAFKELKNKIGDRFGFYELTNLNKKDNLYRVPLTKESIIDIYKLENHYADKINYHPPRYGYQGDIDDVPESFIDAIQNQLP